MPPPAGSERTPLRVHAALLVVQVAFGTLPVEGKLALAPGSGVSPAALAMARILGGAVALAGALAAQRAAPRPTRKDALRLAVLSVFGIVLNQVLFLEGLSRTSPVSATLLVATIPVLTMAASMLAGRERPTAARALGIAVALLGTAAIANFAVPAAGDLLVLLNAASYAVYLVAAKGLLARYGAGVVVAWVFGWGVLLFAPFGGGALVRELPAWSASSAALVGFIVVVPTILAYGLNAWVLRRASPLLVATYVYLQPVVAILLARVQLGQALELHTAIGAALIFAGVAMVARAPPAPAAAAGERAKRG